MRRMLTPVFVGLFGAAFLFGATSSEYPLIRFACGAAITALVVAAFAWRRLPRAGQRALCAIVLTTMFASFAGVAVLTSLWGGGALNGRTEAGVYYLMQHSHETQVSRWQYYIVAAAEIMTFVSWPTGLLLASKGRLVP